MKKAIQILMGILVVFSFVASCDGTEDNSPRRRSPDNPQVIEKGS